MKKIFTLAVVSAIALTGFGQTEMSTITTATGMVFNHNLTLTEDAQDALYFDGSQSFIGLAENPNGYTIKQLTLDWPEGVDMMSFNSVKLYSQNSPIGEIAQIPVSGEDIYEGMTTMSRNAVGKMYFAMRGFGSDKVRVKAVNVIWVDGDGNEFTDVVDFAAISNVGGGGENPDGPNQGGENPDGPNEGGGENPDEPNEGGGENPDDPNSPAGGENGGTSGIENIESEGNAAAEWYTLTGVRVRNPQPGNVYVVRVGTQVNKVVR